MSIPLSPPIYRPIQIFAFDPSLDLDLETARINRAVVAVRWEDRLGVGPVGEYVEVVDIDPASDCVYEPVNLSHEYLLATKGLPPSEGNPQFHQQMVYAVAMLTIDHFEMALGRKVHWSARRQGDDGAFLPAEKSYVPRLRIYPHGLREANAYYSPEKKALLFGYFNALNTDAREGLPGGMVFSCLSHDIIAHETAHAILDGIHPRMLEATNPDVLAFHEGFADIVAIFQHFTLPGVLAQQIAQTRGDLDAENKLAQLAIQFGHATQRGGALRDALGERNETTGKWKRRSADPNKIGVTDEPHARGALLVAAFFDAFITIYRAHTEDLLRIASDGTGILRDGAIHPDLVERLAGEAEKVARRLLMVAIRALDYLPPVDVTFGDYLRALITSDIEYAPDDQRHYRTAIISSFRDWGIYPRDVRTLSVETLRWNEPSKADQRLLARLLPPAGILRMMANSEGVFGERALTIGANEGRPSRLNLKMPDDLIHAFSAQRSEALDGDTPYGDAQYGDAPNGDPQDGDKCQDDSRRGLKRRLEFLAEREFARYLHEHLRRQAAQVDSSERDRIMWQLGIDLFDADMRFEIHAVRRATRVRRDGRTTTDLLVLITQRRPRILEAESEDGTDSPADVDAVTEIAGGESLHYRFRGGCTLLIDPLTGCVRYAIAKSIGNEGRRARQEDYLRERLAAEGPMTMGRLGVWREGKDGPERIPQEPFRMLHQGGYDET